MKKVFSAFLLSALLLSSSVLAQEETLPPLPKGPLILTSVKPEQLQPGYWISKLQDPDRVLKTPKELAEFNHDTRAMVRDQVDIFKLPLKRKGTAVRDVMQREYETLKGRKLFGVDDVYVKPEFFETEVKPLEQLDKIPDEIPMKWGAAAGAASVRALPTDVKMLEEKGDIEFDQLQFTRLKLWTPVGIFHESSDGKWLYIQAPYARGWVKAGDIAVFPSRKELKKAAVQKDFLVVTGESAPLFSDDTFTEKLQNPSMGTVMPLIEKNETAYVVAMPGGGKGYLPASVDVHKGFLPFTQANIIREAFKLLGARYGWGGTYYGRDCSGFTQDVFLTVGVDMPRGSKEQSFVGTQLGFYEYKGDSDVKKKLLDEAVPGITLLHMPHHMMIYLGADNGQYYVIHSTWAERYSMTSDAKNRINQVVVSDLTLNGRSYLGPLFDRIISANEVS